ncbi:MAG: FecR domain-containing protein [Bacteroidota bacterium]
MKNRKYDHNLTPEQEKELFSRLELPYSRSKEEVWISLEKAMAEKHDSTKSVRSGSAKTISVNWFARSAAAAIVLLLGVGLFARFYSTSVSVAAGEFASETLPDGSVVHLNAESAISFAPYWWFIQREVKLDGEAFFEVTRGSKFSVHSDQGTTTVLGTSFNIYARGDDYEVFCATGKVRVSGEATNPVILEPGDFVALDYAGQVQSKINKAETTVLSWRLNKFTYNTTPLTKVIEDLQRQYGIKINPQIENIDQYHYTGLFQRSVTAEEALEIICLSFGLTFEKASESTYIITDH